MVIRNESSLILERAFNYLHNHYDLKAGDQILTAMSGGIDSSVTAAVLSRAGFKVVGVSMQLFDKTHNSGKIQRQTSCCTLDDFQDARRIAHQFDFPYYVLNFEDQFKKMVIDPFIKSYMTGKTPSPCILCNQHVKFDALLETTIKLDCKFLATGHYAQITKDVSGYHLMKAADLSKDQSYFLFMHNQNSLSKALFPLAQFSKLEVRQLAKYLGIHIADKHDSQEICFIDDHYSAYIDRIVHKYFVLSPTIGNIRHTDGQTLGTHSGHWHFTIGQRKGIGISYPTPLFVTKIDANTNTVWVGSDNILFSQKLIASNTNWCLKSSVSQSFSCKAKIRSRSQEVDVSAYQLSDNKVRVEFNNPQRAITPGQAIVFYSGNEVIGGGWIENSITK